MTTDGAPTMVGRQKGAVARLEENNPEHISYHCIISVGPVLHPVRRVCIGDEHNDESD